MSPEGFCLLCNNSYGTRFNLDLHMKVRHLGMFVCSRCNKFSTLIRKRMEGHYLRVHNTAMPLNDTDYAKIEPSPNFGTVKRESLPANGPKVNISCDICFFFTDSNDKMAEHMKEKHDHGNKEVDIATTFKNANLSISRVKKTNSKPEVKTEDAKQDRVGRLSIIAVNTKNPELPVSAEPEGTTIESSPITKPAASEDKTEKVLNEENRKSDDEEKPTGSDPNVLESPPKRRKSEAAESAKVEGSEKTGLTTSDPVVSEEEQAADQNQSSEDASASKPPLDQSEGLPTVSSPAETASTLTSAAAETMKSSPEPVDEPAPMDVEDVEPVDVKSDVETEEQREAAPEDSVPTEIVSELVDEDKENDEETNQVIDVKDGDQLVEEVKTTEQQEAEPGPAGIDETDEAKQLDEEKVAVVVADNGDENQPKNSEEPKEMEVFEALDVDDDANVADDADVDVSDNEDANMTFPCNKCGWLTFDCKADLDEHLVDKH